MITQQRMGFPPGGVPTLLAPACRRGY